MPLIPRLRQEWLLDMVSRNEYVNQENVINVMARTDTRGLRRVSNVNRIVHSTDIRYEGRTCNIPSTVRGSPAYRKLKVDMGMAHVYRFGPPTLFITFTANHRWPEIVNNLQPGQKWDDDPYIVNLVFQLKLRELLSHLERGTFFDGRKCVYYQYTIEFQKRGLPHAHILVRLEGPQPTTAVEVDELCTAALPEPCASQCKRCDRCRLSSVVRSLMFHKCYADRCFTRGDGKCRSGFPFRPTDTTFVGDDGFWVHKRNVHEARIVTYNPKLLLHFDAHINVLVACGTRCVLYLRKYLSKGPDSIDGLLLPTGTPFRDQIDHFYKSRVLTASEAAWIATEFHFNGFHPPVEPIKLYLPGEHPVYFDEGDDIDEVIHDAEQRSHIIQYFQRPAELEEVLFEEFFEKFHKSRGAVGYVLRGTPCCAVVRNVDFSNPEHYSLYLLLKHMPTRSYEDLLNHHSTFQDAALAAGIGGSHHYSLMSSVLFDMSLRHTPIPQMASFLANIAVHHPRCFEPVFHETWFLLSANYNRQCLADVHDSSPLFVLVTIESILLKETTCLRDLLFTFISQEMRDLISQIPPPGLAQFFPHIHVQNLPSLSDEQTHVVNSIVTSRHPFHYVNGCAGSGKTTLLISLMKSFQVRHRNVSASAFTGVAASLLPAGVTCHRLFGLPIDEDLTVSCTPSITRSTLAARILAHADVFIVDEVSMLHERLLQKIDSTLRFVCNSDLQFANKTIILAGDFLQLPPIVRSSPESMATTTLAASVLSCPLFHHFQRHKLLQAQRFTNPAWAAFLLSVAYGADTLRSTIIIPEHFQVRRLTTTAFTHTSSTAPMSVIAPTHEQVTAFNDRMFTLDQSEEHQFLSLYTVAPGLGLRAEELKSINPKNIPPHILRLKINSPVMILRNVNVADGAANGSLATVVQFHRNLIEVRLCSNETIIALPRINFSININHKIQVIRHQFPLSLAYAATINKCQGKTATHLTVDLSQEVFAHGQLYVALSRTRCPTKLTIVTEFGTASAIPNVVIPEFARQIH